MQTRWLVIKLGGTSVSCKRYWDNVTQRLREALAADQRIVLVHSALAGITNLLEQLSEERDAERRTHLLSEIRIRHEALADELEIQVPDTLRDRLADLDALMVADSMNSTARRALILATGEHLMSTLALSFLEARALPVEGIDARELLRARPQSDLHPSRHYLSATCDYTADPGLIERLQQAAPIVLTQGFIAADSAGATVLLGRGGSDTSAACLAAKIGAEELEIWTDVPGLFTTDPHQLPTARLLKKLAYDEALEIAAAGARALHPRCIQPLQEAGIPLVIRYTPQPKLPGTRIEASVEELEGQLKAVCVRHNITTLTLETTDMWQQVGFLADVFACFKRHHLSVDMISTSETSITLTLDAADNPLAENRVDVLCTELDSLGKVSKMQGCAAISLVGRRIRANLHRIAPLLEVFAYHHVHLVCQASNDLNMTFVVDEIDANRLVSQLHALLIDTGTEDDAFGPTWATLCAPPASERHAPPWWSHQRVRLLDMAAEQGSCYVYDPDTLRARASGLNELTVPGRIFYAMKANYNADLLRVLHDCGLGFECVSAQELAHVLTLFPCISKRRILFTPNFAPREEYAAALGTGVWTTLDNLYPLRAWSELFRGHDILLRVDLGTGAGHHKHVRTGGNASKFGIPLDDLNEARQLAADHEIRIVGLHTHAGSGIKDASHWRETGVQLARLTSVFPDLEIIDLGGGLGIPEHATEPALDLMALDAGLAEVANTLPNVELWLEPGRYLVAEAGVLLTRVTQLKVKGTTRFVGVDTGMNSLLRPALYGAYHQIVNLSRLDDAPTDTYTVVGPICETGDILGTARRLPETTESDVLLIANAGAYGYVMSSSYNLRQPAQEIMLGVEVKSTEHADHAG